MPSSHPCCRAWHIVLVTALFARVHGRVSAGYSHDGLRIRFVCAAISVPTRAVGAGVSSTVRSAHSQLAAAHAVVVGADVTVGRRHAAPASEVHPSVKAQPVRTAPLAGYIPGADLLGASSPSFSSNRLPGSSTPIVRGIRMIDPRAQGIGGAVRKIQALLGVPDPHCVDVDAWRACPRGNCSIATFRRSSGRHGREYNCPARSA